MSSAVDLPNGLRVSVIIVNYETSDVVRRCVESLRTETVREIIVVDNPSPANDVTNLAGLPARIIRNSENIGYGRACNVGAEVATGELIAILNPDTFVRPGGLDFWVSLYDLNRKQLKIGVLGPRLLNENETPQRSTYQFLTPWNYWLYHSFLAGALKKARKSVRMEKAWSSQKLEPVGWIMGAALLIPRKAWDAVGGFGENYFLYAEDADLCWRMHQAGYGVYYADAASVYHTQGEPSPERRGNSAYLLFNGIRTFLHQHFSPSRRKSVECCVLLDMMIRIAILRLISAMRPSQLNRSRIDGYRRIVKMYTSSP